MTFSVLLPIPPLLRFFLDAFCFYFDPRLFCCFPFNLVCLSFDFDDFRSVPFDLSRLSPHFLSLCLSLSLCPSFSHIICFLIFNSLLLSPSLSLSLSQHIPLFLISGFFSLVHPLVIFYLSEWTCDEAVLDFFLSLSLSCSLELRKKT